MTFLLNVTSSLLGIRKFFLDYVKQAIFDHWKIEDLRLRVGKRSIQHVSCDVLVS